MLLRGVASAMAAISFGVGAPAPAIGALDAGAAQRAVGVLASGPALYHGPTSQPHQRISFTVAGGQVRKLAFTIVISCASHHQYRLRASGFAAIALHSGHFSSTVTTTHPRASATVTGQLRKGRFSGSLRLRRYIAAEHGFCAGAASYTAIR